MAVHSVTQHRFQIGSSIGLYEFLYDQSARSLRLTQWPDGKPAMRILAAGLPKTIEDATIAAEMHIGYIETGFPNC
jgi:hypothetical protein